MSAQAADRIEHTIKLSSLGENPLVINIRPMVIVFTLLCAHQALAADLKLAASSWPPYTGEDLPGNGLAITIVRQAFDRAGYNTSVTIESWPRTLEGVKLGIFDVIAAAWYTKERARKYTFSEPYLSNSMRLIKRKDTQLQVASLTDLSGLRVGVVRDYAYGEEFDRARHFMKIPQNHVIQNLLMLVNGKIDLTVGDELALRHEIKEFMPSQMVNLEFMAHAIAFKDLHIAVSKQNPNHEQIVKDFNKAFAKMKADGTLEKIRLDYMKR